MHSMAESATTDRREARRLATNRRITLEAQRLVEARGLDGFTMDDLAEAADVSRRTLFNHVGSKLDAVLGEFPTIPDTLVQQFRDGGPHGDLFTDLGALAEEVISDHEATRDEVALGRRMLTEPRLLAASNDRFAAYAEPFVDHIAVREGPSYDEQRARVAVTLVLALAEMALDAFVADTRNRPLVDHFTALLAATRSLLNRP
jgi:AcrR family transcriptional regulator